MNEFSAVRAWSRGVAFLSGNPLGHAALLIGFGILAPYALQYLLAGGPVADFDPAWFGGEGAGGTAAAGAAAPIAMVSAYVLQLGSFFGSWRLGLARGASLGGALGFGLAAGLVVIAGWALAAGLLVGALGLVASPLAILAVMLLLGLLAAAFYSVAAALIAVGVVLSLALAILAGLATGNIGLAATLVGGSGGIVVLLIAAGGLVLWLAARLSCTAPLMAERRSFNPFPAMRESWQLTWDEQWRILRYLALIGLGLVFVFAIAGAAAGFGMATALGGEAGSDFGPAGEIAALLIGVPVAFLGVMVPAGLYRELTVSTVAAAEVFA